MFLKVITFVHIVAARIWVEGHLVFARAVHSRFFLIPKRHLKLPAIPVLAVTQNTALCVLTGYSARSGGQL